MSAVPPDENGSITEIVLYEITISGYFYITENYSFTLLGRNFQCFILTIMTELLVWLKCYKGQGNVHVIIQTQYRKIHQ